MNHNRPSTVLASLLLVLVLLASACNVAQQGVDEYHGLITAYQDAQMAAANGNTCLALSFSQITAQVQIVNNYLAADVEKARVYRQALADYGTKMAQQQSAYAGVQPDKLDLGALAAAGATPADMALTVQVYANTFNEAPLAAIDSAPVLAAQRIVSEQYNQSFACVKDWNDAVRSYNTERNKIPGDVVGTLAQKLGVKDLPVSLPYFQYTAPSAPPAVPTFAPVATPAPGSRGLSRFGVDRPYAR